MILVEMAASIVIGASIAFLASVFLRFSLPAWWITLFIFFARGRPFPYECWQ
jgi:hypothetical protein